MSKVRVEVTAIGGARDLRGEVDGGFVWVSTKDTTDGAAAPVTVRLEIEDMRKWMAHLERLMNEAVGGDP